MCKSFAKKCAHKWIKISLITHTCIGLDYIIQQHRKYGLTNYHRAESIPLWHNFNRNVTLLILRFWFFMTTQLSSWLQCRMGPSKSLERDFVLMRCCLDLYLKWMQIHYNDSVMDRSLSIISMEADLHLKITVCFYMLGRTAQFPCSQYCFSSLLETRIDVRVEPLLDGNSLWKKEKNMGERVGPLRVPVPWVRGQDVIVVWSRKSFWGSDRGQGQSLCPGLVLLS